MSWTRAARSPVGFAALPEGELVVNRSHHRVFKGNLRLFERWMRFKQFVMLKSFRKKENGILAGSGKQNAKNLKHPTA